MAFSVPDKKYKFLLVYVLITLFKVSYTDQNKINIVWGTTELNQIISLKLIFDFLDKEDDCSKSQQ